MTDLVLLSRADIGLRAPTGRAPRNVRIDTQRGWAFHWNGPLVSDKVLAGDVDAEMKMVRSIQDFHMGTRGWSDIAYSFIIGNSGTIYEGRGWYWDQFANGNDEVEPYTEIGNAGWYSVCWLGGRSEELDDNDNWTVIQEPSSAVIRNLPQLVHASRVAGCGLEVHPHADWQRKDCPGPRLTQLARTLHNWPIPIEPTPAPDPSPLPDEEYDMAAVVAYIRGPQPGDAELVRFASGAVAHVGGGEAQAYINDPTVPQVQETDEEAYQRLLQASGTSWRRG